VTNNIRICVNQRVLPFRVYSYIFCYNYLYSKFDHNIVLISYRNISLSLIASAPLLNSYAFDFYAIRNIVTSKHNNDNSKLQYSLSGRNLYLVLNQRLPMFARDMNSLTSYLLLRLCAWHIFVILPGFPCFLNKWNSSSECRIKDRCK